MSLDPALAAVRLAVRRELTGLGGSGVVVVACSGGADSLALLAATVFETRRSDLRVVGVTVDHGLQEGSAEHAAGVVEQMAALGADETATIRVVVDPGPGGIEAGAREARYAALSQLAAHFSADRVLLGHTRDDQAETVLLGLARGSGGRSLQGMRRGFESEGTAFGRPLLDITRSQTEAACRAEEIAWWDDPQNVDPRFLRASVRHTVLPLLEQELGPGVAEALARTAEQLRVDMAELDELARAAHESARVEGGVDLSGTTSRSTVTRVLRLAAIEAGAIGSELTYEHVIAVLEMAAGKEIQLPGHVTARRVGDQVIFGPTGPA